MHFRLEVGQARLELSSIWRHDTDVGKFPVTFQVGRGTVGGSNAKYGYMVLTVQRRQLRVSLPRIYPKIRHWPPLPWR